MLKEKAGGESNMSCFKRFAASAMAVALLVETTGAADLARMMGPAAHPGFYAPPGGPPGFPPGVAAAKAAPAPAGPGLAARFGALFLEAAGAVRGRFLEDSGALPSGRILNVSWAARPEPTLTREAVEPEPVPPRPEPEYPLEAVALLEAPGGALAPGPAPTAAPIPDRMTVLAGPEILGVWNRSAAVESLRSAVEVSAPSVYRPRFEMPWVEGRGVRLRVVYLGSLGETRVDARGVELILAGYQNARVGGVVPRPPQGSYPVYRSRQTIVYEIEVQNTSRENLSDLWVYSRQESLDPSGRMGRLLGRMPMPLKVALLKPGETVTIRRDFQLSPVPRTLSPLTFEQTHLSVQREGLDGARETLLDAPHAGIVDPPRE